MTAGAFSEHLDGSAPFDVGQRGGARRPPRHVIAALIGRWEGRVHLQVVSSSSSLVHLSLILFIYYYFQFSFSLAKHRR